MKTNITLDAGTTAFMATITDKLNQQTKTCAWLGLGLVAFGICNAILIKRIEKLENEVSDIVTVTDVAWEKPTSVRYPWGGKNTGPTTEF